jgi:hypothetical protein
VKQVQQGEHTYLIGKMPARTQLHVMRRLAPILTNLAPMMGALQAMTPKEGDAAVPQDALVVAVAPVANALAGMPDTEVDYILNCCMSVVARVQPGLPSGAPVLARDGVTFMFADLTMDDLFKLTIAAVQENLGNFFDMLPTG